MSRIDEIEERLSVWLLGRPRWVFKDFAYLLRIARAAKALPDDLPIAGNEMRGELAYCVMCDADNEKTGRLTPVVHTDTCPWRLLRAALEGE